ncbi:unnamed protein product, partial [Iphiclides podalirius]
MFLVSSLKPVFFVKNYLVINQSIARTFGRPCAEGLRMCLVSGVHSSCTGSAAVSHSNPTRRASESGRILVSKIPRGHRPPLRRPNEPPP